MVKDHVSEAREMFASGFSCSQAILGTFCEEYGLPKDVALRIASPFGGGFGGLGRTCGALTGAMMVVGLKYGASKSNDPDAKTLTKQKTQELVETFEREHGTCMCSELIGNAYGADGQGLEKHSVIMNTCPKFLETVIIYLEEEL